MATMTLSRPWIWMMVAALALGLAAVGMQPHALPKIDAPLSEHAVAEHGQDADRAKECLDGRPGYLFVNPQSGRIAIVCWLEDRFGIVIMTAALTIITAFVTNKLRTLKRMREYMNRQGYMQQ